MTTTMNRLGLGIVLPLIAAAAGYGPYLLLRSDLPPRLASHFDLGGTPDDSMTVGAFALSTSVLLVSGVAALVTLAIWQRPLRRFAASVAGFLGGFIAGLGAGILGATVISQRNIDDWTEAGSVWLTVAAALALATTLGAVGARLAAALPSIDETSPTPEEQPVMQLRDGEHAVWSTRLHSTWLTMFGIAAVALGVVIALGTKWWFVLPALISGIAVLSLATLHVRADRDGLHVRYGLLPWPRTNVPVNKIETASVIDIRPMHWGGWGYRGSLKLMNQAAVVHRAGPGIRLDLRDGKVFAVTVDDPAPAVALLNAEVERAKQSALT